MNFLMQNCSSTSNYFILSQENCYLAYEQINTYQIKLIRKYLLEILIRYQSKMTPNQVQKQVMAETTNTDQFFDKIYELVTGNLSKTKGMDVIMLLGGTGSGKSTLLNMIAGNQITASRVRGQWHLTSNPSVALIGHEESKTFQPNYWEGKGLRIYDCPGFNDTRSLQYEISKSFFIKEIADNAKSFKIILIGDIHSVKGGRCGPFLAYLNQLKEFIPNYNSSNDYSLVITKVYSDFLPEYIAEDFKVYLKVQIPPKKANLIYEPESKGKYDYSYINFKAIFDGAPSISSKCNMPLSAEAKLKLSQISKELNNSIIKTVKALTVAIRIYYFQVLANKIEADSTQFKKIFQTFQQKDIQSINSDGFVKSLEKYCIKLHNLCQIGFNFSSYFQVINKKINQMQFLKKKIDIFNINVKSWVEYISFNCQQFKKSTNAETMRNLDSLSSFLRSSANIDINKPIEAQAHQHLISQQIIRTKYSGSKQITVQLQKDDICQKNLNKQFVINQLFQKSIPYSGSVHFSDAKTVNGTVSVESCCCGNSIVKRCWACSNYTKTLDYSHLVECSGYADYKGDVPHRQRQIVESSVTIQLKKNIQVKKTCKQTVKYDGENDAVCKSHHRCSCEGLAKIAFSAKNLLEDILCYQQIKFAQEKQIATLKNTNCTQIAEQAHLPIADLSLESYKITNRQLTLKEITDRIHEKLTQRYIFSYPYSGSINVKVEKPYCQNIRFKGVETVTRTVNHSAAVPYRGYTLYRKNQQYSGSVKAHSCYLNCSWCTSTTYNKSYSGSEAFSGAVQYSGTVNTSESRPVMKQIQYDEQFPCAGTLQRNICVQYEGNSQVCCEKGSSVGQGHHDCISCKTWDKFVNAFKKLIEIKTKVIKQVQDNMLILNNLAISSWKKY